MTGEPSIQRHSPQAAREGIASLARNFDSQKEGPSLQSDPRRVCRPGDARANIRLPTLLGGLRDRDVVRCEDGSASSGWLWPSRPRRPRRFRRPLRENDLFQLAGLNASAKGIVWGVVSLDVTNEARVVNAPECAMCPCNVQRGASLRMLSIIRNCTFLVIVTLADSTLNMPRVLVGFQGIWFARWEKSASLVDRHGRELRTIPEITLPVRIGCVPTPSL